MIDPFLAPIIAGDALLMPRATYWPKHGWRCEIVIDDLAGGDAIISDFFETRAEATRWADVAILRAAERYAGCAGAIDDGVGRAINLLRGASVTEKAKIIAMMAYLMSSGRNNTDALPSIRRSRAQLVLVTASAPH